MESDEGQYAEYTTTNTHNHPACSKKLSQSVLAERMQAMSKCDGRQDISREDQWYILQAESSYMSELLIRHLHYLQRHNQHDQFMNEDETGER